MTLDSSASPLGQWATEAYDAERRGEIRTFRSGATRDQNSDKYDTDGFESPLVQLAYAEFMHANRKQPDGTMRAGDNWTRGIPRQAYLESGDRHWLDVRLHMHGHGAKAREDLLTALLAMRFNVNGLIHELLLGRDVGA
jgi:hypothetical protein